MTTLQTKNLGKILAVAMLLGVAGISNAQWGTTTPTTILASGYTGVQGSSTIGGALQITTTSLIGGVPAYLQVGPQNSTYCHFMTNASYFYFNTTLSLGNGTIASYENNNLTFETGISGGPGGVPRMTILGNSYGTTTGYVGIGTSNPASPLTIYTPSTSSPASGLMEQINNVKYSLLLVSNAGSGGYNWTTHTGDNGIFWSDGLAGGQQNSASGFTLAPWEGSNVAFRIDPVAGNATFTSAQGISTTTFGTTYTSALGYGTSYIGFNASRSSTGTWTCLSDGAHNGGASIYSDINGNTRFVNITNSSTPTVTQTLTDAQVYSNNKMILTAAGNLGIGTTNPGYLLDVNGTMRANEVKVCLFGTCDYVFEKDYKLMPLSDLENYLNLNHHLPGIPSAKEMENEGNISLGKMDTQLLQKVEELTLYTIELKKQLDEMQAEVAKMKAGK